MHLPIHGFVGCFVGSLCMVLALKEATLTPFLALDEFDVFMDERNREISLKTLTQVMGHYGHKLNCLAQMLWKNIV